MRRSQVSNRYLNSIQCFITQCWFQAIICRSTPRIYPCRGHFLVFYNFVRFYVNGRSLIKTHLCAVTKPCNIKTNNKLIQLQCLLMHPCHSNNLSNKSMCQLMSTFTGMFVCLFVCLFIYLIVFLGDHLHSRRKSYGLVRDTLISEKPLCKVDAAHWG